MTILQKNSGLFTDHYELTMAQGYYLSQRHHLQAGFDYFYRKNPFNGGFVVFAGLSDLLEAIQHFRFSEDDCKFLVTSGFDKKFVDSLQNFKFHGNVYSVNEGEIIFPDEPVLRVEGDLIETQVLESLILNILNFQSLIATKAARIRHVAGDKLLLDFGMRRAQGLGAIHATKAAMIGGFDGTSNLFSARQYGIHSTGTMAHSWVQTFDNELEAFRSFATQYPESAVLLVDTYDTLHTGIPNAIKIAKELETGGGKLVGIRLDSGDLAYLSRKARKQLDDAGLNYVKIMVSNQLDEYVIRSLLQQHAPVDGFGVGTALVTGQGEGALDGVYKLAQVDGKPTMKVSDNISKMTLPGIKALYRYTDIENGLIQADAIELQDVNSPAIIYHPHHPEMKSNVSGFTHEGIIKKVMKKGNKIESDKSVSEIAEYSRSRLKLIPDEIKRFENPHIYKVGIGTKLMKLRDSLKDRAVSLHQES